MYRKILDFLDWANDNDYPCIHYAKPSKSYIPNSVPNFAREYYPKATEPFERNAGFIVAAKDLNLIVNVFPDMRVRVELVGRSGSVASSDYLQFWYSKLSPMFMYRGFRHHNSTREINLPIPTHSRLVEHAHYLFTPNDHFSHWLHDDFPAICGDLPFPDLPILATPGIPQAPHFLATVGRAVGYLPLRRSSTMSFLLAEAFVPTPPSPLDRCQLVRSRLVQGRGIPNDAIVFLRKTTGHVRLLLSDHELDALLQLGVIVVDPAKVPLNTLQYLLSRARLVISPLGAEWANIYLCCAKLVLLYPDLFDKDTLTDEDLYGFVNIASVPDTRFIPCKTVSSSGFVDCRFELPFDLLVSLIAESRS